MRTETAYANVDVVRVASVRSVRDTGSSSQGMLGCLVTHHRILGKQMEVLATNRVTQDMTGSRRRVFAARTLGSALFS